jgi:hypothetical protein
MALALAFAAAPSLAAPSTPDLQLKMVLESRYAAMKVAMGDRDAAAIRSLLAPGFVSVDVNGATVNADQMVTEIAALPKDPNKKSETTLTSVTRDGDTATVAQQYHMTTTRTRPNEPAPAQIDLLTTSTDTWRLVKGTWLLERTETIDLQYTVNGQVVAHKSRPH